MKKSISFLFFFLLSATLSAQPGSIDLTFNPGDLGFGHGDGPNDYVYAMAEQPDGKILIGGDFLTYNGISRNQIARLHPDGTLDHAFEPGMLLSTPSHQRQVHAIEVLENGKILVGGRFGGYNGQVANNLVLLNPDGSMDQTFDTGTGTNNTVSVIRQQPDGRILIGGRFTSYNDVDVSNLARLHQDGSLDNSFQGPDYGHISSIYDIGMLSDERIIIGGLFSYAGGTGNHYLARLFDDGSVDSIFNTNFSPIHSGVGDQIPYIYSFHIMDNNKILIAGMLYIPGLEGSRSIIRLNEDGTLDEDFEIPVMTPMETFHPYANFISPLPEEDRYLIGGGFSSVNGIAYPGFAVIKSNGSLDVSFDPEDVGKFICAVQQDGGKFVLSTWDSDFPDVYLLRVNEDFTIDPTFNSVTGANHSVSALQPISGNRILASGGFTFYNGTRTNGLIRVFPDGSLDESFMPEINPWPYYSYNALSELPDGRVLASTNAFMWVSQLICFQIDGSHDTMFNSNYQLLGYIYDIKIQRDGKVLLAGRRFMHDQQHHSRIVRLHPDGSVDESFFKEAGKFFPIHRVYIQPDDKILIGGYFTDYDNTPRSRIARLLPDGELDLSLDPGQGLQPYGDVDEIMVNAIGMQQNEKIIAAGDFLMFNNVPVNRIVRLFPDGSLDQSFSTVYGPDKVISDIIVMPDDKILVVGEFSLFDSIPAGRIARLNPNGSLDTTFVSGAGFNNRVNRIALQADGNILAAGSFTAYDGTGRNRLARIKGGEPGGTGRIFSQNGWQVFPNPATERITVKNNQGAEMTGLRLFDLHGRVLRQIPDLRSGRIELETGDIPAGVYILEILESNTATIIKILKQ